MNNKFFEWAGVITAILYSMFVALNIGIEFFGFCLLLIISNFNWNLGLQGRSQGNTFIAVLLRNSRYYWNDTLVLI